MLEILVNKLPGGDRSRTTPLVRLELVNTGEGVADVKVYTVDVSRADERLQPYQACGTVRTHRSKDEDVLVLVHRALEQLLKTRSLKARGSTPTP